MFNLKNKVKNYGFWMSLTGAVILMLQTIGNYCGFSINSVAIESIITSICGVLVVLGIISNPEKGYGFSDNVNSDSTDDANENLEITDEEINSNNEENNKK